MSFMAQYMISNLVQIQVIMVQTVWHRTQPASTYYPQNIHPERIIRELIHLNLDTISQDMIRYDIRAYSSSAPKIFLFLVNLDATFQNQIRQKYLPIQTKKPAQKNQPYKKHPDLTQVRSSTSPWTTGPAPGKRPESRLRPVAIPNSKSNQPNVSVYHSTQIL